jgi:rod shape-determining protein MreC
MAFLNNRVKTGKLSKIFLIVHQLFYKNILISLSLLVLLLVQLFRHNGQSNELLLEACGDIYQVTNKVSNYVKNSFTKVVKYFITVESLVFENEQLKQQILELNNKIVGFELVQKQNSELKNLLNFVEPIKAQRVSSKLISIISAPEGYYGIIEGGKNQLINVDDFVACEKGLVGKVTQISSNYSKVLLINNAKFRTPVILANSGQRGMLIGDIAEPYILYLVDPAQVSKQELIVTAGEASSPIYDLPIGRVSSIDNAYKIKVSINTDFNKVNSVTVLQINDYGNFAN